MHAFLSGGSPDMPNLVIVEMTWSEAETLAIEDDESIRHLIGELQRALPR